MHEQTVYGAIKQYPKDKKGNVIESREIVTRYKMGVGSVGFVFNGKESCDVVYNKKKEDYEIVDGIEKSINYIVDKHIRDVVRKRINEAFPKGETYRSEAEKALAEGRLYNGKERCQKALEQLKSLDKHPLYADKNHRIVIKSVRCFTGLSAVQPLRYNNENEPISFVLTKNNHHVAIYVDEKGDYKECIYTFWQVVERSKYKLPSIINNPKVLWEEIRQRENNGERFPDDLIASLPSPNWAFVECLQLNDMFVMDMGDEEFVNNLASYNYEEIGKKIYRVQSLSTHDYVFRLHTDTTSSMMPEAALSKKFIRIKSFKSYIEHNPHKVQVSLLGKIVERM